MRVLKILKWLMLVVACLFIAIQFKRPARTNPPVDQAQTITAHTQMTPQVQQILNQSCRDCHSNETAWPLYTNISPVSWFVVDHVDHARKDLNFSEWGKYDQRRQGRRLQQMCDLVKDGSMPLSSYTPLHPGSKPTAEDIKTLCAWTEAERARLPR
ncbi:MAG TPA: heme-binding domain-containing protein [Pyrinomonadaceae bacterium]|nr:heme-binding domain-containing protein [Pyrinomonadaceae bacterium]